MTPDTAEIHTPWPRPDLTVAWRAIDVYLSVAYDGKPAPATVLRRLESLPRQGEIADFYACSAFEVTAAPGAVRYSLRLGNAIYPHMKLQILPTPRGDSYLFRADTHDRHVKVAPESPEYAAFCDMLAKNHTVGTKIEAAWEAAGIPTFKSYLRQDLERRRQSAQ